VLVTRVTPLGGAGVIQLAEQLSIPVAQGEGLFADFPTNHPLFVGVYAWPPTHAENVDLVLNLGARMPYRDETASGAPRLIHVSIDPDMIGRVVPTDLGIVADVKEAAADLHAAIADQATKARLESLRARSPNGGIRTSRESAESAGHGRGGTTTR
jgi:thiamine pyrophosphate-dependent acetolactate synthase large subunit-like protein